MFFIQTAIPIATSTNRWFAIKHSLCSTSDNPGTREVENYFKTGRGYVGNHEIRIRFYFIFFFVFLKARRETFEIFLRQKYCRLPPWPPLRRCYILKRNAIFEFVIERVQWKLWKLVYRKKKKVWNAERKKNERKYSLILPIKETIGPSGTTKPWI